MPYPPDQIAVKSYGGPGMLWYYQRVGPRPVPVPVPAGDGWDMPGWVRPVAITGGVLIIAGTLVEDVFTGGLGIADDPLTGGFGLALLGAAFSF